MAKPSEKIPNKIHFIWLGNILQQRYLIPILTLASIARRSEFEINLWVDKESNYWRALDAYPMDLAVIHPQIRNIQELADKMKDDSFYLENNLNEIADKTAASPFFRENNIFNDFWQCVKREMIGLKNLAAASDLLRYAILYQAGGYYFDTDTKFHLTTKSILCSESNIFGFKVQGAYAKENDILSFGGGNDLIAALPKHPILKQIIKDLLYAYKKGDSEQLVLPLKKPVKEKSMILLTEMDLKRAMKSIHPYSKETCINLTLNYTGPGQLYNAIKLFFEKNKYPTEILSCMLAYGQVGNLTTSYPRPKKIFRPFQKHPLPFANIEVESDSHTTWMKQAQTRGTSFDDTAVTYNSIFFKPKRESTELSERPNLKVFEC